MTVPCETRKRDREDETPPATKRRQIVNHVDDLPAIEHVPIGSDAEQEEEEEAPVIVSPREQPPPPQEAEPEAPPEEAEEQPPTASKDETSPRSIVPEYEDYDVTPASVKEIQRGPSESRCSSTASHRRVERITICDADASFILGTGGRTKKKLARVSRAELSVMQTDRDQTVLEIKGSPEAIDRARTYVEFVMQQRVGPVRLSPAVRERNDLVILEIPHECVGYVTGAKGQGLRSVEEEFATLMFFTDVRRGGSEPPPKTETLVIFSPCQRARQGAVLKVMSAVEQKLPGHFTADNVEKESSEEGFDIDIAIVTEDDYSYALGRGGGTRKKLARASGAILEYIGRFAYIAGTKPQRQRAREYLRWLCSQRVGEMKLEEIDERRDDMAIIDVPMDCVAYVTGQKGQALRRMEEMTNTFMFLDGSRGAPSEKLYIFGESASGRAKAKQLAEQRIDEKISGASNYHHRGDYKMDYRSRGYGPPSTYRDNGHGQRRSLSPRNRGGYYQGPPSYNERFRRPEYAHSSSSSYHQRGPPSGGHYMRRETEDDRRKRYRANSPYRAPSPYRPRHVDDFPARRDEIPARRDEIPPRRDDFPPRRDEFPARRGSVSPRRGSSFRYA